MRVDTYVKGCEHVEGAAVRVCQREKADDLLAAIHEVELLRIDRIARQIARSDQHPLAKASRS